MKYPLLSRQSKRSSRAGRAAKPLTLGATLAVLGATLFAGTSAAAVRTPESLRSPSSSVVTLTMWDWVDSQNIINLFEKTHPDIRINLEMQPPAASGEYPKLFAAIKAHDTPDIALVELDVLPQFVTTAGVLDLSKYGVSSVESKYEPWAWNLVTFGGGVYALPLSGGPIGYVFNKPLLTKYGLAVPTTYAQLASEAKTYHAKDPTGYLIGVPPDATYLAMLVWQAGGRWYQIKSGKWVVSFTSPVDHQIANYLQALVDAHVVNTQEDWTTPWYHALAAGTLASYIGPQWGDALLAEDVAGQSGNIHVAKTPQWRAGQSNEAQQGGGSLVIFNDTKYPRQALSFIEFMQNNPSAINMVIKSGYGWPLTLAGSASSTLITANSAYFGGQLAGSLFAKSNATTAETWQWGPNMETVFSEFGTDLAGALGGHGTIWQAFQKEQTTDVSELKAAGIAVVG
jgi:multiple sugar transport system substrate-binding protein